MKKYLITLSSANSRGVKKDSPESLKKDAEKHWSLGFASKYDVTEFSQNFPDKTNSELTKIMASLTDVLKFNKDFQKYLNMSEEQLDILADDLENIYFNNYCSLKNLSKLDKSFSNLNIDEKLSFFDNLSNSFLIVRGSYLYSVVDENELDSFCENVLSLISESV